MKINPGGEVPAYGRDNERKRLWEVLETRSALLLGERRTGKTTLVKAMWREPREGFAGIFRDYASFDSATAFVEALADDLRQHLSKTDKAQTWLGDLWKNLEGAEVGGLFRLPEGKEPRRWQVALERLLDALEKNLPPDTIFVFYWDEFPILLHKIARTSPTDAMDLLDALRTARQRPGSPLRMVFTGSIGLHHVLSDLHDAGNANSPVNDMQSMGLDPLSDAYAQGLAELLFTGAEMEFALDVPAVLAKAADNLPFFIHRICAALKDSYLGIVRADDVAQAREALLQDSADPLKLDWYEKRIQIYYQPREELGFALLDAVAISENPISFTELLNLARHKLPNIKDQEVRITLRHLMQDHYLSESGGQFRFQFTIIRDAWRVRRWLG